MGSQWYIRNESIHKDLGMVWYLPMIKKALEDSRKEYELKLREHPNT